MAEVDQAPATPLATATLFVLAIVLFLWLGAAHAAPPTRIVSLLPSLTETVCAVGACERLVGVDDYSNWPESVRSLPRLGGVDDANLERIAMLRPDLVLLERDARVLPRLRQLGIRVLPLSVKTLADVRKALQEVGRAVGSDNADAAWRRIEDDIAAAAASVPASARQARVYVEIGSDGYGAGPTSHIGELLTRLGLRNIVPEGLGSVPRLNPEFIVRADPAIYMLGPSEAHTLRQRPGYARIAAIREGRVCVFDAAQADVVMRPGPRIAQAAQVLADCVRRVTAPGR